MTTIPNIKIQSRDQVASVIGLANDFCVDVEIFAALSIIGWEYGLRVRSEVSRSRKSARVVAVPNVVDT